MDTKKIKLKRIARGVGFALVSVLVICQLTTVLTPTYIQNRWNTSASINSFYEQEKDSIEVLAIGSSTCAATFNSMQLYEEYGISAYNMGIISAPMISNYYWLKECYKTQNPKVVIIDPQMAARKNEKKEEKFRKSYDHMKWNLNKVQFALQYSKQNEKANLLEYLFPLAKFHTRWSSLTEEDIELALGDNKSMSRGFNALIRNSGIQYNGLDFSTSDLISEKYSVEEYDYLSKIIDLCKEHGSEVLLVRSPDSKWTIEKHNLIKLRAEEKNVTFIDLNEKVIYAELSIDYVTEAADGQHLNYYGAAKVTSYVGNYLKENYELVDYRTTDKAVHFEEELVLYQQYMDEASLEREALLATN